MHHSVGADGVIFIENSAEHDFVGDFSTPTALRPRCVEMADGAPRGCLFERYRKNKNGL